MTGARPDTDPEPSLTLGDGVSSIPAAEWNALVGDESPFLEWEVSRTGRDVRHARKIATASRATARRAASSKPSGAQRGEAERRSQELGGRSSEDGPGS